MLRFSLLTLGGLVTAIGLACAAMVNASPWISCGIWTLTVLTLAFASVVAVLGTSGRRGFWAGFAIVGSALTVVTLSPSLGRLSGLLATTRLLERAALAMPQAYSTSAVPTATLTPYIPSTAPMTTLTLPPVINNATSIVPPSANVYTAPNPLPTLPLPTTLTISTENTEFIEAFLVTGQALSVLVLALVGGLLGRFIVARNVSGST